MKIAKIVHAQYQPFRRIVQLLRMQDDIEGFEFFCYFQSEYDVGYEYIKKMAGTGGSHGGIVRPASIVPYQFHFLHAHGLIAYMETGGLYFGHQ